MAISQIYFSELKVGRCSSDKTASFLGGPKREEGRRRSSKPLSPS
ncbi:unnamed protein product [Brassica oleracea]